MSYKLAITNIETNKKELIIEEDEAQDFLVINTGGEFTDSVKSEDIDGVVYDYLLELFKSCAEILRSDEELLKVIEGEVKRIHPKPSVYYKFTPDNLREIFSNLQ